MSPGKFPANSRRLIASSVTSTLADRSLRRRIHGPCIGRTFLCKRNILEAASHRGRSDWLVLRTTPIRVPPLGSSTGLLAKPRPISGAVLPMWGARLWRLEPSRSRRVPPAVGPGWVSGLILGLPKRHERWLQLFKRPQTGRVILESIEYRCIDQVFFYVMCMGPGIKLPSNLPVRAGIE